MGQFGTLGELFYFLYDGILNYYVRNAGHRNLYLSIQKAEAGRSCII